jgi:hypothetical protein
MRDQRPIKCVWRVGSTNKDTMKCEPPELCKMRKCEGQFRKWKDVSEFKCKMFMEDINGNNKV